MRTRQRSLGAFLFLFAALLAHATINPALQSQLGNPSNATADPANHVHFLIQRAQYALDFNDANGDPNWVSWNLTSTDVGSSGRSNFLPDPELPAGFYPVVTSDYTGSGYDRGHMCPSADRTISTADNQIVFYMSNIIPQTADNNQGPWASFETYCRTLASAGNEILIICGPSGFAGSRIPSGKAAIPGHTWKIAVVVPLGAGTALSRIDASTRVIALKLPNIAGIRSVPWQNYITSAAQIESDTGYNLFRGIEARDGNTTLANQLRAKIDGQSATGAPTIATQPSAQSAPVGGNASFSVSANGDAPLAYQWLKDDVEIADATNATLALTNIQAADAATYTVVITNGVGSITSAGAALVVTGLPPTIASQPASRTAGAGTSASFSVSAGGTPPFTYQWRKGTTNLSNGGNVSGATSATLVLGNVQSADAATDYNVIVTNSVSSTQSSNAALTVTAAAPTITIPPANQSAMSGSTVSLTVTALGTAPLSYQWRKGGSPLSNGGSISGVDTATLTITNAQTTDSGSYDVVVSNGINPTATSAAATLTVSAASASSTVAWNFGAGLGSETALPTSGLPGDVTVTAPGVTQNNNNGTTTMITATSANTASSYTGASAGNNAGAAARTGALNRASGGSAYFEFTLTPAAGKQLVISAISFGSRSTGTGPLAYDIYTSVDNFTTRIANATLANTSTWALQSPAISTLTGSTGTGITFRIYGYNGTGSPSASTANWRIDDLKVTLNTVVAPPTPPAVASTSPANGATNVAINSAIAITFNQAVNVGNAWFSINSAANGVLAATVTGGPTTYTLTPPTSFSNGDTITVTLAASQIADQATGTLHPASNSSFSFTTITPTAPSIATPPVAQAVSAGGTATFSVVATGTAPLGYQWRKGGVAISGNGSATTPTLTLTNVQAADAGSYDVVVTNGVNPPATSAPAALTVNPSAPTVTTPPIPTVAVVGGSASFTVAATGTSPFTYQWRKGGVAISGNTSAATATLTLTNVQAVDAGSYDVVVSNGVNPAATSSAATLTVNPLPQSTIYWDFAAVDPTSGVPSGLTVGSLTQNNNNGTTAIITATSASSGYSGASGGNNAGAAARTGALNKTAGTGSAYFEFTLTPAAGQQVIVSTLGFGSRSTGTGPQAYSIFTSLDGFAAPIATGTLSNNSAWTSVAPVFAARQSATGAAVTFRMYGHGGTGSPGSGTANWRIDDLKVGVLVGAPPAITTQPISQTATAGGSFTLSVVATGSGPLTYKWYLDGALLGDYSNRSGSATASVTHTNIGTVGFSGDYTVVVSNAFGSVTSSAATVTVNKADQAITFPSIPDKFTNDAPFTLGATASSTFAVTYEIVTGPATVSGNTVTLTGIPGSVTVRAHQAGDINYNAAPDVDRTFAVTKHPATVALTNLAQTYTGAGLGVSVTTVPAGLATTVTYNGSSTLPTNAGTYLVAATIVDNNYSGSTTASLTIAPAAASIALSNLTQAYDGLPKPVTATTTPAGLNVVFTYGGSSTPPTNPGAYAIVATIVEQNYVGSANGTLVIGITALVTHAPEISGALDGSLQLLSGENFTLSGNAWISGDVLVPGLPQVVVGNKSTLAGTLDGIGSATPANYQVTLSGNALARYIVRRTNPIPLPTVSAPPAPAGTRDVVLTSASQGAGDFATLRNLTLGGNAGRVAVPAGTYGAFATNGNATLVLGSVGATTPAIYNFQNLALAGNAQLEIAGPVIVNLAHGLALSRGAGAAAHPEWLVLNIDSGGLSLDGSATLHGTVNAPRGTVAISGTLHGTVASDRLIISGNGALSEHVNPPASPAKAK